MPVETVFGRIREYGGDSRGSHLPRLATHGTVFLGESRSTDARVIEKKKAQAPKRGRRSAIGDRRQFLTMMSPDVIKAVKQAAIAEDRAAWDIMEEAAKQWLDRRKGRRGD
jgi:hypothetical protein